MFDLFIGLLMPLIGTSLGACCILFLKKGMPPALGRSLAGFAAGVMTAASVWSLLIPSVEQSSSMGKFAFFPAFAGFWLGILFLLLLDRIVPHMHPDTGKCEGLNCKLGKSTMLVLAVALHNLPEGMAVGAVFAGGMSEGSQVTIMSAVALSVGIAIQNFPEGAIVSAPLLSTGMSKRKAVALGVLSGAVEPLGALVTYAAADLILPALPYFLSFAAGAMIYVVVEELIPEISSGEHSNMGAVTFAIGFSVMMILDVVLG